MQTAITTNSASAPQNHNPALTFIVGQDRKGHWVALETHGKRGGIFASKDAAINYAAFEVGNGSGAVRVTAKPIELTV
jgi:hypothetical protein